MGARRRTAAKREWKGHHRRFALDAEAIDDRASGESHEPDDPEFIDIIRTPFEADSALLLCSDGLTDLVTASAIADIVRVFAGHP